MLRPNADVLVSDCEFPSISWSFVYRRLIFITQRLRLSLVIFKRSLDEDAHWKIFTQVENNFDFGCFVHGAYLFCWRREESRKYRGLKTRRYRNPPQVIHLAVGLLNKFSNKFENRAAHTDGTHKDFSRPLASFGFGNGGEESQGSGD